MNSALNNDMFFVVEWVKLFDGGHGTCIEYIVKTMFFYCLTFVALEFDIDKGATLPKQIKYSLRLSHTLGGDQNRWRTENTYPNFQAVGPRKDEERSEIYIH